MDEKNELYISGIVMDEHTTTYILTEVQHQYSIEKELLNEMIEHGLIVLEQSSRGEECIDLNSLHRLQLALRLHRDLSVNMPGAAMVLDLLQELHDMRSELDILHKHFQNK